MAYWKRAFFSFLLLAVGAPLASAKVSPVDEVNEFIGTRSNHGGTVGVRSRCRLTRVCRRKPRPVLNDRPLKHLFRDGVLSVSGNDFCR